MFTTSSMCNEKHYIVCIKILKFYFIRWPDGFVSERVQAGASIVKKISARHLLKRWMLEIVCELFKWTPFGSQMMYFENIFSSYLATPIFVNSSETDLKEAPLVINSFTLKDTALFSIHFHSNHIVAYGPVGRQQLRNKQLYNNCC